MLRILFDTIRTLWKYRKDLRNYGIGIFEWRWWRVESNLIYFHKIEFDYSGLEQPQIDFLSEADLESDTMRIGATCVSGFNYNYKEE